MGLYDEIVNAVNQGRLIEPLTIPKIREFVRNNRLGFSPNYVNVCLANASKGRTHSLQYPTLFERTAPGEYRLIAKERNIISPLREQKKENIDGLESVLISPKTDSLGGGIINNKVVIPTALFEEEVNSFAEFIVKYVKENPIGGLTGWSPILKSYTWGSSRENDYKKGLEVRAHFNYILKEAIAATGMGSGLFREGIINAIVGWAGIKSPVSLDNCELISDSVEYLNSVRGGNIDYTKIYGERIASVSKVYYFNDHESWTIYDSRVAAALRWFAQEFRAANPEAYERIEDEILFPVPPSQGNAKGTDWEDNKDKASLWFVRASLLLKQIADILNNRTVPCLTEAEDINPRMGQKWKLYSVEMVMFMIGEDKRN